MRTFVSALITTAYVNGCGVSSSASGPSKGLYDFRNGGDDWATVYPTLEGNVCGTGVKQSPIDLSYHSATPSNLIAIDL